MNLPIKLSIHSFPVPFVVQDLWYLVLLSRSVELTCFGIEIMHHPLDINSWSMNVTASSHEIGESLDGLIDHFWVIFLDPSKIERHHSWCFPVGNRQLAV